MNMISVTKQAAILKAAERIINTMPRKEQDVRCETAVAKLVLLNGKRWYNGECFEPKVKNIGCGVKEIWYDPVK